MSVVVVIRFPVSNVADAIAGLNANAAVLEEITELTKDHGMVSHRFLSGSDHLAVVDEWESADQFQAFFDGNPRVAEVMTSIGMSGPPEISVFESVDAPGNLLRH